MEGNNYFCIKIIFISQIHILFILGLAGFFPLHPMTYITAKRNNQTSAEAQAKAQEQSKSDLETKETAEVEANS